MSDSATTTTTTHHNLEQMSTTTTVATTTTTATEKELKDEFHLNIIDSAQPTSHGEYEDPKDQYDRACYDSGRRATHHDGQRGDLVERNDTIAIMSSSSSIINSRITTASGMKTVLSKVPEEVWFRLLTVSKVEHIGPTHSHTHTHKPRKSNHSPFFSICSSWKIPISKLFSIPPISCVGYPWTRSYIATSYVAPKNE
jgi:hypothetical protein